MQKGLDKIKLSFETIKENIKLKEKSVNNLIIIDFSLFYFPGIKLKFFTNYFKDENSYNNFMFTFYCKILKHLKDKTYTEIEKEMHTHYIKEADKVAFINKILDEYKKEYPFLPEINIEMRQEFYQISGLSGSRIIGTRYGNIFHILFFDPYHLIYPDSKYNIDKISYKSGSIFYINEDIKIFSLEHLVENEKCICCEVMDKLLSHKTEK